MHTLNRRAIAFAVCLSALAGCVDVIGFLHLGGYFVAFMSGNSTQLAAGLARGDTLHVVQLASLILLFVVGTMMGALTGHGASSRRGLRVLRLVTWCLFLAAAAQFFGWNFIAIVLLVLAMGAENSVFQRDGDVVIGLTYMTGTLVKMGQKMAAALLGGPALAWLPYGLLWAGLLAGGVAGAVLYQHFALNSLWAAAAAAALASLYATLDRRVLPD
ncbi:YoaK family protein [Asticcacaulis sp. EMRT-3]|uniref:YoaK family protein n=1 Tax=Asticcacaulis sp. EMRT-3 TaxID=3040349 RepID=UPI0024AF65AB|nr:YoaK family protein [Asticcacaulis sp. EMRT-3]MDI7774028.1 YoaK family protein [Asticcacaulis sp. EMRT-3]